MLPRLSAPVSGVDCPSVDPRQPLCSPLSVQPPTPLSGSRRQLSFASPYHFRIRRDFMSKNPLSGFAPKQTRLLWRPTHIVLQGLTVLNTKGNYFEVSFMVSLLKNTPSVSVVFECNSFISAVEEK